MTPRSRFRPCIDLHDGVVKQIIGGSLSDRDSRSLKTNFISSQSPAYYARLFKENNLTGGHVIKLGPGNDEAAKEALAEWPNGFHVGGGITDENATQWIEAGAEKVVVTSYLFPSCRFSLERLERLSSIVGREKLVIDVSCRRKGNTWYIAMNKWQDLTDMEVNQETLDLLSRYCSEFLIHAADVEGLCQGIDEKLVEALGRWVSIPTTYAGGAKDISDLDLTNALSNGKVDLTYGSALDIYGGKLVKFSDLVERERETRSAIMIFGGSKTLYPALSALGRSDKGEFRSLLAKWEMARPPRQCWHYDPITGRPLRGSGCPAGSSCPFIHPDSPRWKDASRSVPTGGKRQRSRDHSPASVSFDTSYKNSESMQDSWGSKRRELSSRLSDPKTTKGLSERLSNSASSLSTHGWGSLSSRIQDPQSQPPSTETLTSRISDPAPISGWGAGSSNKGSSSGWGAPADDSSWPEANWGTTKSKSDIVPPRGPRKQSSPSLAPKPSLTQRPGPQKISISFTSPAIEPSGVAAPQSPSARTKQSRSPPPPRSSTQQPPPLIPPPIQAPPPTTQPPPLPPPPPAQSTTQPLPPQAPAAQQSRTSAPPSPVRTRPSLSVGVPPLSFDQPVSAVTATTQTPFFQTPRSPDQQFNEVTERKDVSITTEFQVAADRLRTLCRVVVYFMEYREAEYAAQCVRHQRASYKSYHIGEGAQAKIEGSLLEIDARVKDKLRKFEGSLSRFANTNIWPTVVPPDSRLEGFTQQLQDLQKRVEELSEKVEKRDSLPEESMTVEEIVGQQTDLLKRLDRIEVHQADIEGIVEQRLEDLSAEQKAAFKDLTSKAEVAQREMDSNANLVKEQILQLTKDQQAFGEEIAQIYIRQADAVHGIQQLQQENEELKQRLVMYEKRDVRLRSELQAATSSLDVLKNQQKLTMQERVDHRLLESMKTAILDQIRERIEERFSLARQEIELRMKSAQELTTKDFDTKYAPVVGFLNQLRDHLQSAINGVNRDSTLN